jgi:hypothetical protein
MDKVKLLKSLMDSNQGALDGTSQTKSRHSNIPNKNILAGLNKDGSSRHEDVSIDQFSGGVDFLMDENILTNDSREEEEGARIRTPNNIKNLNVSKINE